MKNYTDRLLLQPHHLSYADAVAEFERTGRGYFSLDPAAHVAVTAAVWSDAGLQRLVDDLVTHRKIEFWSTPRMDDVWHRQFVSQQSLLSMVHAQRVEEAELYVGQVGSLLGVKIHERGSYDRWLLNFIDQLRWPRMRSAPPAKPSRIIAAIRSTMEERCAK